MKKILILCSLIIGILVILKDDSIVIPENAIRFRVVANSNSIIDQTNKNKIAIALEKYIYGIIDKSDVKNSLLNQSNDIDNYIKDFMKKNNINQKFSVSIGKNYFPEKEYKGIKYNAGYYDSIVVNLGYARGLNWWCVIYPPLCMLPENTTDVEYTSLVSELLKNM